jgi:hypothetical protein
MDRKLPSMELTEAGSPSDLRDRLGWLDSWRVDRGISKVVGRAVGRLEEARTAGQERVGIYQIEVATQHVIATIAASKVVATGIIEARLNTNAGAVAEILDEVEVARVASSIGSRNKTLRELGAMREAGEFSPGDCDELEKLVLKQHRERIQDASDNRDASRGRMQTIVSCGLAGSAKNERR